MSPVATLMAGLALFSKQGASRLCFATEAANFLARPPPPLMAFFSLPCTRACSPTTCGLPHPLQLVQLIQRAALIASFAFFYFTWFVCNAWRYAGR